MMNFLGLTHPEERFREEPSLGEKGLVTRWALSWFPEDFVEMYRNEILAFDQLAREVCWQEFLRHRERGTVPFKSAAKRVLIRSAQIGQHGTDHASDLSYTDILPEIDAWAESRAEAIMRETRHDRSDRIYARVRAILRASCLDGFSAGLAVRKGMKPDLSSRYAEEIPPALRCVKVSWRQPFVEKCLYNAHVAFGYGDYLGQLHELGYIENPQWPLIFTEKGRAAARSQIEQDERRLPPIGVLGVFEPRSPDAPTIINPAAAFEALKSGIPKAAGVPRHYISGALFDAPGKLKDLLPEGMTVSFGNDGQDEILDILVEGSEFLQLRRRKFATGHAFDRDRLLKLRPVPITEEGDISIMYNGLYYKDAISVMLNREIIAEIDLVDASGDKYRSRSKTTQLVVNGIDSDIFSEDEMDVIERLIGDFCSMKLRKDPVTIGGIVALGGVRFGSGLADPRLMSALAEMDETLREHLAVRNPPKENRVMEAQVYDEPPPQQVGRVAEKRTLVFRRPEHIEDEVPEHVLMYIDQLEQRISQLSRAVDLLAGLEAFPEIGERIDLFIDQLNEVRALDFPEDGPT